MFAGVLIRQIHLLWCTLIELAFEVGRKERRKTQDVFVGSEHTLIRTNGQGDDGADQGAVVQQAPSAFVPSPTIAHEGTLSHLPEPGLSSFCCNFNFVCSRNDFLLGLTALPARSLEWKERNMLISSGSNTFGMDCQRSNLRRSRN